MTKGELNRLDREIDRINKIMDCLDPWSPAIDYYQERLGKIESRLEESLKSCRSEEKVENRDSSHIRMKELGLEVIPGRNRISQRGIAKLSVVKRSRRKRA